jgi:hypothetical protein
MPTTVARSSVLLVLALALAAAIAIWAWSGPDAPAAASLPPRDGTAPTTPATADLARAADAAPRGDGTADDGAAGAMPREAARATATTGDLLVRVVWGDDGLPAPDTDVRVWRPNTDDVLDAVRGTTDAAGTVRFARLAPGNVYPQLERGRESEFGKVAIVAGECAEVTLRAKVGMNCKGRVVDGAGSPVADADVVFAAWGGGRTEVIARSAADGTFTLRAVSTHCHIGARKAGLRPSSLRQFSAGDGANVELTIVLDQVGATLVGTVLAPDGEPVADAVVRAGSGEQRNHKLPDGASAMAPQQEYVRTDAAGRFVFASAEPGTLPVAARARGLAPWQGEVEVAAGRTTELPIRLQRGASLSGTARDEAGKTLAKVEIRIGGWDDLGSRRVGTGADGSYRVDALASGTLSLFAERDGFGKVRTQLALAPGEHGRWDPVLSAGLQQRGRVLDADGKPVKGVMVEGQLEQGSARDDHWWAHENTDDDGRFVLTNCKDGKPIRLTFRRKSTFPELVKSGVLPSATELVVQLPAEAWVHIEGRVLGPDGEVLPHVRVSPSKQDSFSGTPAESADPRTGAFRYGPYPPGTYSLRLAADGHPPIRVPARELAPNETWSLGELRFVRGGTLVAYPVAAGPMPKLTLRVDDASGEWRENLQESPNGWRSGPLSPGRHTLLVAGEGIASRSIPFEIRAGAETKLDVPVVAGRGITIECVLPPDVVPRRSVALVVTAGDQVVWRGNARARDGRPATALSLAPGTYTVEASVDALRATGTLVVDAAEPATLVLTLARD